MGEVFRARDALSAGLLSRRELARYYQSIQRGVYLPAGVEPTLADRLAAVSLAAPAAVIGGVAASALHGAKWVDPHVPIEVITTGRAQRGLVVRRDALAPDEMTTVSGIRLTTLARTAYDLARQLPRNDAVARLDALMAAQPFSIEDVQLLAKRHAGARGLRQLRAALPLIDGGAASPRETRLRLLVVDAGLPRPDTQIVVVDERGRFVRRLDMGWDQYLVAAEYDGDQHRTDRAQYIKDLRTGPKLNALGWKVIRVVKEDHSGNIVHAVRSALMERGWQP